MRVRVKKRSVFLMILASLPMCGIQAQALTCDWESDIISLRNMPADNQSLYSVFTSLLEDKLSNDLRELVDQNDGPSRPVIEFTHVPKLNSNDDFENGLITQFSRTNSYAERYLKSTGYLQLYVFERIAQENQSQVTTTRNVGVQTKVYLGEHRGNSRQDEYLVLAGTEDASDLADKTIQFSALLAVSLLNRKGANNTCALKHDQAREKINQWLADANVTGAIKRKIDASLESNDD